MKASKLAEVGQIRRRSGISMKMSIRPETLDTVSASFSVYLSIREEETWKMPALGAYRHIMLKMMRRLR